MEKKIVYSVQAPKPVGPYSQAVQAGGLVFIAGQIPLRPDTGELLLGDIKQQTRQVLTNVQAVLQAAGCTMADVVKTTVYLTDFGLFPQVNEVYAAFFPKDSPARGCVGVSSLPGGAAVEIEAIAVKKRL